MVSAITGMTAAPITTGTATTAVTESTNFDTFLKMLTTQLQNQDPLNPMEGSDFAVQLATFSGVEQQAQTNKLLQQGTSKNCAERASGVGRMGHSAAGA